jgi:GLPGLI family protein
MLILFFYARIYGQDSAEPNKIYVCTYHTLYNYSLDNGEDFKKFESTLLIKGGRSFFFSVPTKETYNDDEVESQRLVIKKDTLFTVIKLSDMSILLFKDNVFAKNGKMYSDTLYPMQWDLKNEKKMIDSLTCFKATTFFKGRNYIAWYCPGILIPDGPWKLGNLPGLIIEAYDENKQLQFLLKSFKSQEGLILPNQTGNAFELKSIPPYPEYVKSGNNFIKKFKEQMGAQPGSCLDCQAASKIEFHNWENVFQ